MPKIAALLTAFNRREKTIACLQHLFDALEKYNREADNEGIALTVFLTDDGCTDGTAEAVRQTFAEKDIHILQGNGSLFWAGGMRLAWQAAIDSGTTWDFFLLLNDDTNVYHNMFAELFEANEYGYQQTGRYGLSSGIACQPGNKAEITYGGMNFVNKTKGRQTILQPSGKPQHIDMVHANILLVHASAIQTMGIFYDGYIHGCADIDYGMTAHRHQLPVFSTANVCGECECDHDTSKEEIRKLMTMPLADRKRFVNSPTHSDHDYLLFVRRNIPLRYPIALFLRRLRLYWPALYYYITNFRGVYKSR